MASINTNATFTGLTSLVLSLPNTDYYTIQGSLELPNISKGSSANSAVVVTVLHNVTTVYTGSAGAAGFSNVGFSATAGDTVTVTLSSSAAVDQPINAIKCSVQLFEGAI